MKTTHDPPPQETFKPKIQVIGGEENDESLFALETSTIQETQKPAAGKWAEKSQKKNLIEEISDDGGIKGCVDEQEQTQPQRRGARDSEREQSLHLLRGLREMDSTGFSRKGVIEIGADDVKEPFRAFEDEEEEEEGDGANKKKMLVEELDDDDDDEEKEVEGESVDGEAADTSAGMRGGEFLRSGGLVDYNLNVFGFQ